MNEDEFLKEHPSLKGKLQRGDHDLYGCYQMQKLIHETQLDKKIVEKAIDKIRDSASVGSFTRRNWAMILKKELGLK